MKTRMIGRTVPFLRISMNTIELAAKERRPDVTAACAAVPCLRAGCSNVLIMQKAGATS
jgi:hypothetical protein